MCKMANIELKCYWILQLNYVYWNVFVCTYVCVCVCVNEQFSKPLSWVKWMEKRKLLLTKAIKQRNSLSCILCQWLRTPNNFPSQIHELMHETVNMQHIYEYGNNFMLGLGFSFTSIFVWFPFLSCVILFQFVFLSNFILLY